MGGSSSGAAASASGPRFGLAAFDLDGTLLDSNKRISDRNREALFRAERAGVRLAVISGRRFAELESLTVGLPAGLFRAGHGGALIRQERRAISEIPVPRAAALEACRIALTPGLIPGLILLISDRDGGVRITAREAASERVARYLATVRPRPRFESFPRFVEDPLHVVLAGRPAACRAAEAALGEALGETVTLERTEYPATDLGLLDVLGAGANKGAALARIAEDAGVPLEATLAFGDNWNDVGMLEAAGLGFLMENAEPELKALGFPLTGSHDAHGVASALDRLIPAS